ncbi:MAG: nitrous oxide reductase family maturation protein NosD [Candidatus Binatia bacterium]
MNQGIGIWSVVVALLCVPLHVEAFSAVFDGDPVNPATGVPYEMLPGLPLIQPGPDDVLGTADDVVDSSLVGDIDLVVRSGALAATVTIPPPTAAVGRGALPIGVAGPRGAGGTPLAFTVFLSDGKTSSTVPSGGLLAAPDMDGIPVIVAAFADLDGDGFIGPTDHRPTNSMEQVLEVRELDPVGRAVALFDGGVVRGSVAIRTGRPGSQGGLTVALTALARTGPLAAGFFEGHIPAGPGISTAQPFLPQSDLSRLIRGQPAALALDTTIQPVVQFAAVPDFSAAQPFALPLDGSVSTIDAAVVNSQSVTRAVLRSAVGAVVKELLFGPAAPANRQQLVLVPVDRWGNPGDPPPGFTVTLRADPPLQAVGPFEAGGAVDVELDVAEGVPVTFGVPVHTPDGTRGSLTLEQAGVVVGVLPYRVDARANRPEPDLSVPSQQAPSIQAAIDSISDSNGDGLLVINLEPGLYRENVLANRPVVLYGAGMDSTILQGDGSASVLRVTASNVAVHGLTVLGGMDGFTLDAPAALLAQTRAWRNLQAGVSVSGSAVRVWHAESADNSGSGLRLSKEANDATCSETRLVDNHGAGADLVRVRGSRLEQNFIAGNDNRGVRLISVNAVTVSDNQIADNLGSGIELIGAQNSRILGNLSTTNNNGLYLRKTTGNLISANVLDLNSRYGIAMRDGSGDDFSAAPGLQAAPGDNRSTNNIRGEVFTRRN